jgi:hypothetical protein
MRAIFSATLLVLEKIFLNNFLLSEEITSVFPKLLGNFSWVLGQCRSGVRKKFPLSSYNNNLFTILKFL